MGMYLNPGTGLFEESLNSEIYVDKTEMVLFINSVLNTNKKYMCISRPRRFGKTMAISMLCAYYGDGDSRELFEKTKLSEHENWDRYLNRFDVIKLVMTDFLGNGDSVSEILNDVEDEVTDELMEAFPDTNYGKRISLHKVMNKIYAKTGRQFVVVVDEWDAIFRESSIDKDGQKIYLDFLRNWFKDKEYIALAYMTGILPVKKYGRHSALNMFDEYSMIAPLQMAPFTGFTDGEVKELCRQYGRNYEKIKEWYDGYNVIDVIPPDPDYELYNSTGRELKPNSYALYSPLSVVNAVSTGIIQNYWNKTETYEALAEYIRMDYDGLKDAVALMMDGGRVKVDVSTYQNDMSTFNCRDDILALLINLGYLCYDSEMRETYIPNKEILDEFKASTKSEEWKDVFRGFKKSMELLEATWKLDEERVAELLEEAHDRAGNKTYNDEAALSYAIQLAYYAAQKYYTTILELDSGKGYADIVYLPAPKHADKPAMVVELKYNKDAGTALDQIRQRNYPDRLSHYKGNILLVGISYDSDAGSKNDDFKRHSCKIEQA